MDECEWVLAGDLLGTLELEVMPESVTPLDAIVFVKALDEDGDVTWYTRTTRTINSIELIGMLSVAKARALNAQTEICFEWDEEDD